MTTQKGSKGQSISTHNLLWRYYDENEHENLAKLLIAQVREGNKDPLGDFMDHPLGDSFMDFASQAVKDYLNDRSGIVYVVANPTQQGFYKIGMTRYTIENRLKSLSGAGVVGEFIAIDTSFAIDRFAAEKATHRAMREKGAVQHKEFFYCTDYNLPINVMRDTVKRDNESLAKAFWSFNLQN